MLTRWSVCCSAFFACWIRSAFFSLLLTPWTRILCHHTCFRWSTSNVLARTAILYVYWRNIEMEWQRMRITFFWFIACDCMGFTYLNMRWLSKQPQPTEWWCEWNPSLSSWQRIRLFFQFWNEIARKHKNVDIKFINDEMVLYIIW